MAKAVSKLVGISSTKLRHVVDLVRGEPVDEAIEMLRFMTTPAATNVRKTVQSAAANAENNDLLDRDSLIIKEIYADKGPSLKRFRPKARGRVGAFDRPTSHITVIVEERDEESQ